MAAPNFTLISELIPLTRRDFPAADPTLLSPTNANPLIDGEFLELNSSYQMARGSGSGNATAVPLHTEKGRYDTQALGKVSMLYAGQYEAETTVVAIAGLAVGDALMVGDVTIGGLTRRGLLKATGVAGTIEVGYVTKLYGSEVKVRFRHDMNLKHA